jgi:hypothetical protein
MPEEGGWDKPDLLDIEEGFDAGEWNNGIRFDATEER